MQCVKGRKNSSQNLTGKWSGQSHAILDTRVPRAQFLDTVGRELHGKIATVFKDYYWGRERRVKKTVFLNIFHQMSEISTMPCAYTQLFQGYTLLPVQLYVSRAQIFFPINFYSFIGINWTLLLLERRWRVRNSDIKNSLPKSHLWSLAKAFTSWCATVTLGSILSQFFQSSSVALNT